MSSLAVLDIGKTNVKLVVLDEHGHVLHEQRRPNTVLSTPPYPHYDIDGIWHWLIDALRQASTQHAIHRIVTTTHGACAALVNDEGLVLPILDYEHTAPEEISTDYDQLRDAFGDTYSPALPMGLNLGRQLYWQQQRYPVEFSRATRILLYPQFWAWKLCGVAAAEVTSLGCHTDLWNPAKQQYSTLARKLGWDALLPPIQPAWQCLGTLKPELCEQTGLPRDCQIISGIHDSNASLLPHLVSRDISVPFSVISTGTWVIIAAVGAPLTALRAEQDMLANVDAYGRAVACARFMGGREFAALNSLDARDCASSDLDDIIRNGVFALPAFAETGGPFPGRTGRITGPDPATPASRNALATLYCALVTDHCMSALGCSGDIVIEGSFIANPHYAAVLAALRPQQRVLISQDAAGTVSGAYILGHWGGHFPVNNQPVSAYRNAALLDYQAQWQRLFRS